MWVCIEIATIEIELKSLDLEITISECYLAGPDCLPLFDMFMQCAEINGWAHPDCLAILVAFLVCVLGSLGGS